MGRSANAVHGPIADAPAEIVMQWLALNCGRLAEIARTGSAWP
jgi:hypothetical protein